MYIRCVKELQYYCTTENLLHRQRLHNVKFHTLRRTILGLLKVLRADGACFRWSVIPCIVRVRGDNRMKLLRRGSHNKLRMCCYRSQTLKLTNRAQITFTQHRNVRAWGEKERW